LVDKIQKVNSKIQITRTKNKTQKAKNKSQKKNDKPYLGVIWCFFFGSWYLFLVI
jgi:hypothetical protein